MSDILLSKNYKSKPIISWYNAGDPTRDMDYWKSRVTDINIITTKRITKEFADYVLKHKNHFYLHIKISGMGASTLEPNIPSVKSIFESIRNLVSNGFPAQQILILVDPIIPNSNGLKALELLLRVFTESRDLHLRYMRVNLLNYTPSILNKQTGKSEQLIASKIIRGRLKIAGIEHLFKHFGSQFITDYYKLLKRYEIMINVDKGDQPIIGDRELKAFGISNLWKETDGSIVKLIHYQNNNKSKPMVKIISKEATPVYRCPNKCVLCPHKG